MNHKVCVGLLVLGFQIDLDQLGSLHCVSLQHSVSVQDCQLVRVKAQCETKGWTDGLFPTVCAPIICIPPSLTLHLSLHLLF